MQFLFLFSFRKEYFLMAYTYMQTSPEHFAQQLSHRSACQTTNSILEPMVNYQPTQMNVCCVCVCRRRWPVWDRCSPFDTAHTTSALQNVRSAYPRIGFRRCGCQAACQLSAHLWRTRTLRTAIHRPKLVWIWYACIHSDGMWPLVVHLTCTVNNICQKNRPKSRTTGRFVPHFSHSHSGRTSYSQLKQRALV